MKRFLFLVVLFLTMAFAPSYAAQALQVDKSPGDPVEIAFDYPVSAESGIDGFLVEKADDLAFTLALSEVVTAGKTLRKITVVAGSKPAFYRVKAFSGVAPTRATSAATNPVAVNIILKAPVSASAK